METEALNLPETEIVETVETHVPQRFDCGVLKGQIEALLFLTGRALYLDDLAEKLLVPKDDIELALLELIQDYAFREDSALEIDDTDGYILQVKEAYSPVVNYMVPVDLSMPALRMLSAIALHGPLLQSELIASQGSHAYDYIRELVQHRLVSKKRRERSFMLSVTPRFYEYFKLTGDKEELKTKFKLATVAHDILAAAASESPEALEALEDAPVEDVVN